MKAWLNDIVDTLWEKRREDGIFEPSPVRGTLTVVAALIILTLAVLAARGQLW